MADTPKNSSPETRSAVPPTPLADVPAISSWMKALGWMFKGAGFAVADGETPDDQFERWKGLTQRQEQFRRTRKTGAGKTDISREAWDRNVRGAFPAAVAKTAFPGFERDDRRTPPRAIAVQAPAFQDAATGAAGWRQEICALADIGLTPREDTTPYIYKGAGLTVSVSLEANGTVKPVITVTEQAAYTDSRKITAEKPEPSHLTFTGAAPRKRIRIYGWNDRLKAQEDIIRWIDEHNAPAPVRSKPALAEPVKGAACPVPAPSTPPAAPKS